MSVLKSGINFPGYIMRRFISYLITSVVVNCLIQVCVIPLVESQSSLPHRVTEGLTANLACMLTGTFALPSWSGPPSSTVYTNQGSGNFSHFLDKSLRDRLSYNSNQKDIRLTAVQQSDTGSYMCSYSGLGYHTIELTVLQASDTESTQSTNTGETVIILCSLTGTFILPSWRGPPSSTIYTNQGSGRFNGALNSSLRSRLTYHNEKHLRIRSVEYSDTGEYTCSYTGLGQHTITLTVMATSTTPAITTSTTPAATVSVIPTVDGAVLSSTSIPKASIRGLAASFVVTLLLVLFERR